ncbi:hypothetical protein FB45DRAFT_950407 [Roridomyces roridus]|uniref:ARM repeat-containing protein n=1 Tax=Roridomyces roridus TaxID=1738132 RepID=A0AAD7B161_9AGAR|nr:hypothetical protein FB45DRAFT_950407 [Roridomyces roridus]
MRLMYHRQAIALIESNRSIRLSPPVLENLSSYLLCKYVARRTQTMVLEHLCNRAFWNLDDARDIQHSPLLGQLPELLADESFRISTVSLVQSLLAHSCGIPVSSTQINTLESLMINPNHLSDEDLSLQVASALSSQAGHPPEHGPGQHPLVTLLSSSNRHMRWWACNVIIFFFQDDPGTPEHWIFPAAELVKLLRDEEYIADQAVYALALGLERWEVAASIVEAAMLYNSVKKLCEGLARLEGHHSMSLSMLLEEIPMGTWLADVEHMDKALVEQTVLKLVQVSQERQGRAAILESGVLQSAPKLLSFKSSGIRSRTCELVENLAQYDTRPPEIVVMLSELLRDSREDIVIRAVYVLNQIPEHLQQDEVVTLVATNFLGSLPRLLRLQRAELGYPICKLTWDLVKHDCEQRDLCGIRSGKAGSQPVINAVLSALADGVLDRTIPATDDTIVRPLAQTIAQFSGSPTGAQALVASRDLRRYLCALLASKNPEIRQSAFTIMENLATHELAAPVILDVRLCGQVLSLARRRDMDATTRALAMYTLGRISRCYRGVTVLVELGALGVLRGLKGLKLRPLTSKEISVGELLWPPLSLHPSSHRPDL